MYSMFVCSIEVYRIRFDCPPITLGCVRSTSPLPAPFDWEKPSIIINLKANISCQNDTNQQFIFNEMWCGLVVVVMVAGLAFIESGAYLICRVFLLHPCRHRHRRRCWCWCCSRWRFHSISCYSRMTI